MPFLTSATRHPIESARSARAWRTHRDDGAITARPRRAATLNRA
jgi:hypothetical protein